ncbi:MAG: hypothetical protein Kow0069_09590 [Promethearchaeota archaeon]
MRWLVLCAHPDDLEFSIPSLLIALSAGAGVKGKNGPFQSALERGRALVGGASEVRVACLTRGEMSDLTDLTRSTRRAARIRTRELDRSQRILCGREPDFLGFFDQKVEVTREAVKRVEEYARAVAPHRVVAPEPVFTWYPHRDHVNAGRLAYLALYRWYESTGGGDLPLLYYFQATWNDWYFPRFEAFREAIESARAAHASQRRILRLARVPGFVESRFHGLRCGTKYAEALRYQPVPATAPSARRKSFRELAFWKRVAFYVTSRLESSAEREAYERRFEEFNDGTLQPRTRGGTSA